MGWTSYIATNYKNGKIDRKAEMDNLHNWENETTKCSVLKSQMVGAIYYAAIEHTDKITGDVKVVGSVCITSTKWCDGMNFGYKGMSESSGPCYCDCPKSILDLLTPTEDVWAIKWREKCRENLQKKKEKKTLSLLPIGTRITWIGNDGERRVAYKHKPYYQFKRPFWMIEGDYMYVKQKNIPNNWEILKEIS